MATKSLLLSCLLMGLGAPQHPASEGTQTPNVPFPTAASSAAGGPASSAAADSPPSAAGSATSTATSTGPVHDATDLPLSFWMGFEECDAWGTLRVLEEGTAAGTFCTCSYSNPYWLKDPIRMFQVCEEQTTMEFVKGIVEHFEEHCPYPGFGYFICTSFEDRLRACKSRPRDPECQHLSQVLKDFGSPYWDDSKPHDKSSSSVSPGEQIETLHRRQNLWSVVSTLTDQDTLERRGADEPYHPVLKRVFEDCDALNDVELLLECIIKVIQRALYERDPQIVGCEDVWSDGDDEVPFNPAASDNNEDSSHSQFQVTAAPQQVTTGPFVDGDDLIQRMKYLLWHCRQVADSDALKRCVDKVLETCSRNPADELCQGLHGRS